MSGWCMYLLRRGLAPIGERSDSLCFIRRLSKLRSSDSRVPAAIQTAFPARVDVYQLVYRNDSF